MKGLLGIEQARVDKNGVRGGPQRGGGAGFVLRVPRPHLDLDFGQGRSIRALQPAAPGAGREIRGHEQLDRGVGGNDGANIPPVQHGASRRDLPLVVQKRRADGWYLRHGAGRPVRFRAA